MMRDGQQVLTGQKGELEEQLKHLKEEYNAQSDQMLSNEKNLQEVGIQKGDLEGQVESLQGELHQ